MKIRLQAFNDLLQHYIRVFQASWSIRHQLDSPDRESHELAFLPAHLELAESPSHPAPKWTLRLIVLFSILIVIWSIFGKLDIVASAQGKLVPNAQVKVVQPLDTGMVRSILVVDGQRVKAGQPLIEMDTTQTQADADKDRSARQESQITIARAQALINSIQSGNKPKVAVVIGLSPERQLEVQHFAEGQFQEYRDKHASQESELAKRQAELTTTGYEIDKLQQTAPLAKQAADNYRALMKNNYVSKQDYLDKEQARIEKEKELAAQQSHAHELQAAVEGQQRDIAAGSDQFRREQMDELNKAQQQLVQYQQDENKAVQRQSRMVLRAPVDGTVQQLAVHTVGGVITQAQAVMKIVPDDTLEVDASIDNKDIGFVNSGQEAVVKIDSFPYTHYGYLKGVVSQVSNDASPDKKLGLVFPARIKLQTNRIQVENKWVNLSPGMSVTVEIKTGKRAVAEYFLSPLIQASQESLRER